jgi:4-hydroxy-tetrahydrodipicolinate synthase
MKQVTQDDCADVLVVAITPRKQDRTVSFDGIRGNVRRLIESGISFIMPECGTGLVYDATLEEYEAVVGAFIDAAGDEAFVVPGIGPGYGRSIEMGRIARSLNASGVMVMPIVGPASPAGVLDGVGSIVDEAQLPVILYQRRADIMPADVIVALCERDGVVGLKYSVDDLDLFGEINDRAGGAAAMACGMAEDPSITYLEAGAVGFSSGMANFVPRLSLELLRSFRTGDTARAERIRKEMVPFEDFRAENGARYSASALHAAMDASGLAGGPVIPFAEDVAESELPRVRAMLNRLRQVEEDVFASSE